MPMPPCYKARHCRDGLKADSVVVVFLPKEGVNKHAEELHKPVSGTVDKVLWLIVVGNANTLQVRHGETRRKRLRFVR